jgi:hypothetical protein
VEVKVPLAAIAPRRRHKGPVHGVFGTYLVILLLNARSVVRVYVSYRAFSRRWAFRPLLRYGDAKQRPFREGRTEAALAAPEAQTGDLIRHY